MSQIIKPLIIGLISIMVITLTITKMDATTNAWANDELDYALRTATQDATSVIMAQDFIFGTDEEASDFAVDIAAASKQFEKSFFANIGSTITPTVVNEASVSLSGIVGYRYIYGMYADKNTVMPLPYAYYKEDENAIYNFTLGNKIYKTTLSDMGETIVDITTLPENYFHAGMTNENFRTVTVMSTINQFLDLFYGDGSNVTAVNTGSGVKFNLGLVDYAAEDPTVMTKLSSVIDGPGFFAVVDCNDTELKQVVRIMSLGAAELKLSEDIKQAGYSISGVVVSYNAKNPITYSLYKMKSDGTYETTATYTGIAVEALTEGVTAGLHTQGFVINNIENGTYKLVISKTVHLDYIVLNVVINQKNLNLSEYVSDFVMGAGDVDKNGAINTTDSGIVARTANYGHSVTDSGVTDPQADINGDGYINSLDSNIVTSYYGRRSSDFTISVVY